MSNEITVYDKFKKQLAEFKAADAKLSFDVETPEGYADCKDYYGKLREVRNRTDDLRLDTTKELRGKVKAINNDGNEIIAEVDALAAPYSIQLDAEDAKERKLIDDLAEKNRLEAEAVEAKRLADLEEREAKAQAIIDAAAKVEADAKAAQEAAGLAKQVEADKLKAVEEAKAQAKQDAKEAMEKAAKDKQDAIDKIQREADEEIAAQKAEAHQKENDRIAKEIAEKNRVAGLYAAEQAEKERLEKIEAARVADVTHRNKVEYEIGEKLFKYVPNITVCNDIIEAMKSGEIPHIEFKY